MLTLNQRSILSLEKPSLNTFRNVSDLEHGNTAQPFTDRASKLVMESESFVVDPLVVSDKFLPIKKLFSHTKQDDKISMKRTNPRSSTYKLFKKYQKQIYMLLEEPMDSKLGKFILIIMLISILFSSTEAIYISLRSFQTMPTALIYLNTVLFIIFSLEFLLRLFTASAFEQNTKRVLLQPIFIVDLIAIIPLLIEVTSVQDEALAYLDNQRYMSLAKALTILKVMRYVKNGHILAKGIKQCFTSLGFLFVMFMMTCVAFAVMAYYAEKSNPQSKFNKGIPNVLWWTIVTMTTVGYGDMVPLTPLGKMIGGMVSIFGMMLLAFPVAILGYHFQEVYNDMEEEQRIQKLKEDLQKQEDLDENQKEAYFLKKRTNHLETSNQEVHELLTTLNKTHKRVSSDLKSLYNAINKGAVIAQGQRTSPYGKGSSGMTKFLRSTRKIKVLQVFQGGFTRKATRSSHGSLSHEDISSVREQKKRYRDSMPSTKQTEYGKSSFFLDFKASIMKQNVEDIVFDTGECISRISSLVPNSNPMKDHDVRRQRKDVMSRYSSANQKKFEPKFAFQIHGRGREYYERDCSSLAKFENQDSEFEYEPDTGHIPLGNFPSRADNRSDTIQNLVTSCKTLSMKGLKTLEEGGSRINFGKESRDNLRLSGIKTEVDTREIEDEELYSPFDGLNRYEEFKTQDIELDVNSRKESSHKNSLCLGKSSKIDKQPNYLFVEVPFKKEPPEKEAISFSNIE